jgi:hypothetical protein
MQREILSIHASERFVRLVFLTVARSHASEPRILRVRSVGRLGRCDRGLTAQRGRPVVDAHKLLALHAVGHHGHGREFRRLRTEGLRPLLPAAAARIFIAIFALVLIKLTAYS